MNINEFTRLLSMKLCKLQISVWQFFCIILSINVFNKVTLKKAIKPFNTDID